MEVKQFHFRIKRTSELLMPLN